MIGKGVGGLEKARLGLEAITENYKKKISASILPPDPLRIAKNVLRIPVAIEHALPVPPILETIHSNVTEPLIEELPRLPLTGDLPVIKWNEWVRE